MFTQKNFNSPSWTSGVLPAVPQCLEESSNVLLEGPQRTERFDVYGQEEMTQWHGFRLPRRAINAADVLAPRARLYRRAQELDCRGPSVSLISTHLVPCATKGSQGALPQFHVDQNALRVRPLHPHIVDHHSPGCFDPVPRVFFDLTALIDGGGAVDNERERVRGGDAEGKGVRAHPGA